MVIAMQIWQIAPTAEAEAVLSSCPNCQCQFLFEDDNIQVPQHPEQKWSDMVTQSQPVLLAASSQWARLVGHLSRAFFLT